MKPPLVQRLQGKQVDLIEVQPVHLELIMKWRNDPETRHYFFSQETLSLGGQLRWFEHYRMDPTDLTFVIVLKTSVPVGMVAVYSIDDQTKTGEFGRLLIGEKAYRRKGIAYEASRLILDFAFDTLALRKVYLEVYDWNVAAICLYERLGFVTKEYSTRQDGNRAVQPVRRMTLELAARV